MTLGQGTLNQTNIDQETLKQRTFTLKQDLRPGALNLGILKPGSLNQGTWELTLNRVLEGMGEPQPHNIDQGTINQQPSTKEPSNRKFDEEAEPDMTRSSCTTDL